MNRYIYGVNNPVMMVDVSGFEGKGMPSWYRWTSWVEPTKKVFDAACAGATIASLGSANSIVTAGCTGYFVGSVIGDTVWGTDNVTNLRNIGRKIRGVQFPVLSEKTKENLRWYKRQTIHGLSEQLLGQTVEGGIKAGLSTIGLKSTAKTLGIFGTVWSLVKPSYAISQ